MNTETTHHESRSPARSKEDASESALTTIADRIYDMLSNRANAVISDPGADPKEVEKARRFFAAANDLFTANKVHGPDSDQAGDAYTAFAYADDTERVMFFYGWARFIRHAVANQAVSEKCVQDLIECARTYLVIDRDDDAYRAAVQQFHSNRPPQSLLDYLGVSERPSLSDLTYKAKGRRYLH